MCIICSDWLKGKLTNKEAQRNLSEFISAKMDSEEEIAHYYEVAEIIAEEDLDKYETDKS